MNGSSKGLEQAAQQPVELLCCHAGAGVNRADSFTCNGVRHGAGPRLPVSPVTVQRVSLHGQERWGEGVFRGALSPPPHGAGRLRGTQHSPPPALLPPGTPDPHSPPHPQPEQESGAKETGTARRHRRTDLAVALPRDRVAHARFGARLVAVTPPAVGVVVVARGTEVTLSSHDIGLAPGWDARAAASETSALRCCAGSSRAFRASRVGEDFPMQHVSSLQPPDASRHSSGDRGRCQTCPVPGQGSLTCTARCPRRSRAPSAPARRAESNCSPRSR